MVCNLYLSLRSIRARVLSGTEKRRNFAPVENVPLSAFMCVAAWSDARPAREIGSPLPFISHLEGNCNNTRGKSVPWVLIFMRQ